MNLFGMVRRIFTATNKNFDQLITNSRQDQNIAFAYSFGDSTEADGEDKAVVTIRREGDYLKDDTWECMANFCGTAFTNAMERACDQRNMTNPLKVFHNKKNPQTLCFSLKKDVEDNIKIPTNIALQELEKLEKLMFSDWKATEIDDSGESYLVKTFDNENDRDSVYALIKSMAKVYGLKDSKVYLEPEEYGNNCTLLLKSELLVTLANREETYECNISRLR